MVYEDIILHKSIAWLVVFFAVLIWSGINPKDQFTWFLEVAPAIIALPILIFTRKSFALTSLAYVLILIHCVILMVGGHYTYAEVPLFDWIADWTGGGRNNYDKVGHLAQGFIPALLAREVFIRLSVVKVGAWCNFLAVCFALAFSAFYELIEWWVAELTGEDAEAFLGTQGYVWDTQSDMAMALIGAIASVILLGRIHDKQLRQKLAE
ncbi:membrane protein [Shewanella sairae]|uniref:Membrane protein n=1 Tax=Shewanella sairae TaxID=190310 RepID=A0ABQ4PLS9_9GAMM|nr:membrane protein [Shewanella sairae]